MGVMINKRVLFSLFSCLIVFFCGFVNAEETGSIPFSLPTRFTPLPMSENFESGSILTHTIVNESYGRRYVIKNENATYEMVVVFSVIGEHYFTLPKNIKNNIVKCLVVAGGGGGGQRGGGGGGAGGMLEGVFKTVPGERLSIKVGSGGVGGKATAYQGQVINRHLVDATSGEDSYIKLVSGEVIVAFGGGAGGSIPTDNWMSDLQYSDTDTDLGVSEHDSINTRMNGVSGGSGGGAAGVSSGGARNAGKFPAYGGQGVSEQGCKGFDRMFVGTSNRDGGGGGGAGGASTSSAGGEGRCSSITGSQLLYAAGGAGGSYSRVNKGGSGIGGDGGMNLVKATSGAVGTGSGGGAGGNSATGATYHPGGDGACGVVVLRYAIAGNISIGIR
jgi:hypothetical protein